MGALTVWQRPWEMLNVYHTIIFYKTETAAYYWSWNLNTFPEIWLCTTLQPLTPGNTCLCYTSAHSRCNWREPNLIFTYRQAVTVWKWGCSASLEQHKELALYSIGNTVILAQEAAGTRSVWPLTLSEAECNHYRHVQYSLCHRIPFFLASSKLLPITICPGEAQ